jgi:acyl carrier protein
VKSLHKESFTVKNIYAKKFYAVKGTEIIMEFEKMKEVIANVLNVDPEEITLDTTFTEDLGADSLDLFQIIMGLEDEFDVQIDPEKTENITTVGEAVELLKTAISSK